jgi:protein tyrosine phosphatase
MPLALINALLDFWQMCFDACGIVIIIIIIINA